MGERIDENSTIPAKVVHPMAHVIGNWSDDDDDFKASSIRAMSPDRLPKMASVEAPNVPRRLATERPASAPPTPAMVIRARDSRMWGVCFGGIGGGDGDEFSGEVMLTVVIVEIVWDVIQSFSHSV